MTGDNAVFVVDVGWTSQRPIIPDQHTTRVAVAGHDSFGGAAAAQSLAAQIVATSQPTRRPCVMPTSTTIVSSEL